MILKSNEKIHEDMVESLVRSPLAYFDTTPSGQVTNRFSSDLALLDNGILYSLIGLMGKSMAWLVMLGNAIQI